MTNVNAPSAARASRVRGKRGAALLRTAVLVGALCGVTAFAQADTCLLYTSPSPRD